MAIAGWLIWETQPGQIFRPPLILFALQLLLNIGWTICFFGLRNPGLAFIEIIILWIVILLTTVNFWILRPLAGILFLPYLLWVSFAGILNYTIWQLNR